MNFSYTATILTTVSRCGDPLFQEPLNVRAGRGYVVERGDGHAAKLAPLPAELHVGH